MNDYERCQKDRRKIELYQTILRHVIGVIKAIAEMHLGYRIDVDR